MYITKEELDKRLASSPVSIITKARVLRTEGLVKEARLDNGERALIGLLAESDTQKDVAKLMGVSQTTVSNVSRGLIAPSSGVNLELKEKLQEGRGLIGQKELDRKDKIQDQLINNLSIALAQVSEGILNTDANEASKIAVDMSKILDRVNGDRNERQGNRTAIIINVPAMKEERSYQSLSV